MFSKIINKYNNLSVLKKMVLIFIIILIIPLNSFYLYSARTTERIMIEQAYRDHMNNNNLIKKSINDFLTRITSVIMFIYNNDNFQEIIEYENKIQLTGQEKFKKLKLIDKLQSSIQSLIYHTIGTNFYLTLISPSHIIYSSHYAKPGNIEKYISQYTSNKINNYKNYILEKGLEPNYIAEEDNPYVITFLKTVETQSESDNRGLMIISIPEDSISEMVAGGDNYSSADRFLINQKGQVIASSNKEWLNKSFKEMYSKELPDSREGYIVDETNKGIKSLITYSKIGNNSWSSWQLVNIISYQSVTGAMNNTIQRLLFVNLLIIIIFFIVALILAKSITGPIHKLSRMMTETNIESKDGKETQLDSNINEILMLENSFNKMKNNVRNLIMENREKEERKREAELEALQAQISPHFLFNTLNAIRWAALNKNMKKAADMVLALINLLKMTIVRGEELITLEQEIENIKNYVSILQLRHATNFKVDYLISKETRDYLIPRLLLQPIVENAVLHGFEELDRTGIIEIKTVYENNNLYIIIEDNGIGIDLNDMSKKKSDRQVKFTGIGINNVDERIKLYFGKKYGLSIDSKPGKGTRVNIVLPGE